jgi:hypothetical protein
MPVNLHSMATDHAEASAALDPLLCDFPLPLSCMAYPMGYPLEIMTNSAEVVLAAEEAWGQYPCRRKTTPVKVRLAVVPSGELSNAGTPSFRSHGHIVACSIGRDDYVIADLARGFLFGWLTPATVSDRDWFRYHVLEGLVYMTLSALYCTPVHAACIARNGRALLLCGNSGAGKTSLAYACARSSGWTYLGDDATYLPRDHQQIVAIGRPRHVRFRASATALFPELTAFEPVQRPNGKPDIEASSEALGLSIAYESNVAAVIFLNRSPGVPAGIEPFSTRDALEHLSQVVCYGEERVRREQREHLRRLVQLPTFEIRYSKFKEAEKCLRSVLELI